MTHNIVHVRETLVKRSVSSSLHAVGLSRSSAYFVVRSIASSRATCRSLGRLCSTSSRDRRAY
jgi:hypothetical protein